MIFTNSRLYLVPSAVLVTAAVLFTACSHRAASEAVSTAALDDAAWQQSQWISVAAAPVVDSEVTDQNHRSADGASCFLSTVTNSRRVRSARWMTAGLGVYDLYVNSRPVGREVLRPGFTHPYQTKRSFTYDITPLLNLKAGAANVLAVQVTPGWWADKIVTPWGHRGMVGRQTAFRGVLELTYTDGTVERFPTDRTRWRGGIAGPVTHASIFDGEAYDARLLPANMVPEQLSAPVLNDEFRGDVLPSDGAEVYHRDDLALKPVQCYVWQDVEGQRDGEFGRVIIRRTYEPDVPMTLTPGETLVVDFGQNCAAVPEFEFLAPEGTRLTFLPGELLNDGNGSRRRGMDGPEGSVHRDNLRIAATGIRLDYTFAATAEYVTFRPRATFFGYRYASISATDTVRLRRLRSVPVTSIAADLETGTITTGNELVNRLIQNTVWGMRSNYLSVPTDCPQRNERLGWTADTQVFAETGTFFANTRNFFHKWMRDMRDTQSASGGFPGVAPLAQYGNEMMRVGWADAGIIVPWTIWKQYGDTAIIRENWSAMMRFMGHVNETKYDHKALIAENGNYQWADWLSYEPLESCSGRAFDANGPLPDAVSYWNYLNASYWAIDAAMMADMARAIHDDEGPYEEMYADAVAYLKEQFLNPDGTFKTGILNTMQTPALFALKNNLVSGEARRQMIARLRQNFADHDGCLQTGFLGTSILMATLTENGLADLAYDLLLQRRNPSWLYSIDQGATTIWERWNSYMVDQGMGPQGMNSFNHYAYGAVCEWLWETVAGIAADPAQPGFRHIIMRPVPDRRLSPVSAEYHSAAGLIRSAWRYEGSQWTWHFTIPRGATASVQLPGETGTREYAAGQHSVTLTLP